MGRKLTAPALALLFLLSACGWVNKPSPPVSESPPEEDPSPSYEPEEEVEPHIIKDPEGAVLETRFFPPEGFTRTQGGGGESFGAYLRALPLKPDGAVIYLHDGTVKPDDKFEAVLDMRINNNRNRMRGIHFPLRLYAEYLFHAGQANDISFHFMSGFTFDFAAWAAGSRLKEEENGRVVWQAASAAADGSYESLWEYLQRLYNYANTASVRRDLLQAVRPEAGFLFVDHGGAVIADMAQDAGGRTAILLLRAGDPEQEGYVVKNIKDADISPWFIIPDNGIISTPEGEYSIGELYMFR
jgi:hypothetical protein